MIDAILYALVKLWIEAAALVVVSGFGLLAVALSAIAQGA